jgi:hypothetical protein
MKLATLTAIVMLLAGHGAVPALDVTDEKSPVEVTDTTTSVGESGGVLGELTVNTTSPADKATTGRVGHQTATAPKIVQADDGERDYWYVYYGNVSTGEVYVSHVVIADGEEDKVEVVNIPDVRVHPSNGCNAGCERLKLVADLVRALTHGGMR